MTSCEHDGNAQIRTRYVGVVRHSQPGLRPRVKRLPTVPLPHPRCGSDFSDRIDMMNGISDSLPFILSIMFILSQTVVALNMPARL